MSFDNNPYKKLYTDVILCVTVEFFKLPVWFKKFNKENFKDCASYSSGIKILIFCSWPPKPTIYIYLSTVPVLRIRIRRICIITLDPDPYKKLAVSEIRIRIKWHGSGPNKNHWKLRINLFIKPNLNDYLFKENWYRYIVK